MLSFLLDLVFPQKCVSCQSFSQLFCTQCKLKITQKPLICPVCYKLSLGGKTHDLCSSKYSLDGLWTFGSYSPPLNLVIQKLKYNFLTPLAQDLINLIISYWALSQPLLFDQIKKTRGEKWLVTFVPLHSYRQNWRGFNQSQLLAQTFAQKLDLSFAQVLVRTKNTIPQAKLSASQRRQNLSSAFQIKNPSSLKQNIILIDDVWTTGSTLKKCCYLLKLNGAKTVWALTLAR